MCTSWIFSRNLSDLECVMAEFACVIIRRWVDVPPAKQNVPPPGHGISRTFGKSYVPFLLARFALLNPVRIPQPFAVKALSRAKDVTAVSSFCTREIVD